MFCVLAFEGLKQAQHAYLVWQLANKPDLSKLKLQLLKWTKLNSENTRKRNFTLQTSSDIHLRLHFRHFIITLFSSLYHRSDGMETERSYSGRAGGQIYYYHTLYFLIILSISLYYYYNINSRRAEKSLGRQDDFPRTQ